MDQLPSGFIGSYISVNDTDCRMTNYQSLLDLWKHRDRHQIFIVNEHLAGADVGLAALSRYCQHRGKKLLVDRHECKRGCQKDPEIESVDISDLIRKKCPRAYCLTHSSDPKSIEDVRSHPGGIESLLDCCIILEQYMYDSLVGMTELGLENLYHETVPIHWCNQKQRLESIYGDIWYKSG